MADFLESSLRVRFPALGKSTTNVTSWSIDSNYLISTDGFEFELYDPPLTSAHRLEMQPVELYVNDVLQAVGRIDVTDIGSNGRALTCQGRDYIADIVEGNVDPRFKLKPTMTVSQLLLDTCGPYGIDTVFDDSDDGVIMSEVRSGFKPRKAHGSGSSKQRRSRKGKSGRGLQDYQPKPGEGVYEYCNRIIARIGATIQPGPSRSCLCVTEPNYEQGPSYVLQRTDDPIGSSTNNVLASRARRDFSRMPTFSLFNATESARGGKGTGVSSTFDVFELAAKSEELLSIIGASTVSGRWEPGKLATQVRDEGKLYRLLNFRDDAARTKEQLDRAKDRAVAERLKDTLTYECTMRGHGDPATGAIYSIDTITQVADDICGLRENLWVLSRRLSYGPDGATTQMTCIRPDSFVIDGSTE